MTTLLKSIPKSELPRERLVSYGAENLSNEELLSILLRTGIEGHPVSDLSREILSKIDSIQDLKDMSLSTLKSIKGLGLTKSITVLAALELGRRVYEENLHKDNIRIKVPIDAYRYFSHLIAKEKQENFLAIFVDHGKKYISHKLLFKGTLNSSLIHPREVFKSALLENAAGVIVMHNHPSGEIIPSSADDEATRGLVEAGNVMGITLLDHLVVGKDDYYSYAEEGRIAYEQ